ncbi:MAG: hypothetical protein O9972_08035, partial [Burkholderiales bacterium]|nr:hypothetical protein [Burkholderiales bacterium]
MEPQEAALLNEPSGQRIETMAIHPQARAVMAMIAAWQQEQGVPPRTQQSLALSRELMLRMAPLRRRGPVQEMASVEDVLLPARGGPRRARV